MKTRLICYFCRYQIVEVYLNTPLHFEIAYDFCPDCEGILFTMFARMVNELTYSKLSTDVSIVPVMKDTLAPFLEKKGDSELET